MARHSPSSWAGYLSCGTTGLVGYAVLPSAPADALYAGVGLSATVAVAVGVRRYRPVPRRPWVLLLTGLLALNVGDGLSLAASGSGAGAFALAGYLMLLAAVALLMRRLQTRAIEVRRGALLDVGIVVLTGGLLLWQLVLLPALASGHGTIADAVAASAVPLLNLAVLAVVLRLAIGAMSRGRAVLRLLLAAVGLALLGSFLYAAATSLEAPWIRMGSDLAALAAYLLVGAAALHPAMPRLAQPAPGTAGLGRGRLLLLAGCGLVGPALLLGAHVMPVPVDQQVAAAGAGGVLLLVVARATQLVGLVGRQAQQLRQSLAVHTRLQDDLRHQAEHDQLTGLPNRARLIRQVERALDDRAAGYAVALLDLDDFKAVNDQAGLGVGDALLVAVARRLCARLRAGDVVARLGGDEFGLLLRDVADESATGVSVRRVLGVFAEPFGLADTSVRVTASVGVTHPPSVATDNGRRRGPVGWPRPSAMPTSPCTPPSGPVRTSSRCTARRCAS